MTVQYGGKTKEAKLKDLYDDIAANEEEWLTFLNHPYNIEFVFECVAVCHEYAKIQYDTHKDRDTCLKAFDIEKKLLDILQKLSAHFDEYQKGAFGNLEYEYGNFIFKKSLVVLISGKGKLGVENAKLFKKLVRFEKKNNPPADYLGYIWLWGEYRKEMKERGMDMREIPHNVEEVDDKVIAEHMRARRLKGIKRDDRNLKKGLIEFFELDGTIVSSQKKKRIEDFVKGLTDEKAIEIGSVFGSGMGNLSTEQKMEFRKKIDDIDEYLRALEVANA